MTHLIADIKQKMAALDAQQLRRNVQTICSPCAPHIQVGTHHVTAFCSNDYLGLASHPRLVAALQEGAALHGVGSGASHLISGHTQAHALLEERLAAFMAPHFVHPRALYFSSGYMANLAILCALGEVGSEMFSEALNHASLIDGARLSRAKVHIYPHGDVTQAESLLKASTAPWKLLVTDAVFSMDGEIAPLAELLALCERYGAWLIVDDAHGFGVLGSQGRGTLEYLDLASPNLIYMGTLGKAAGVSGAFVVAHESVIEWLVQRARTYIYTTASPPALAHALLTSLDILAGTEGKMRRAHLQNLITQWQAGLRLTRWRPIHSNTAIQPLVIGDNGEALCLSAALYEQGLWVPAIRPPTVPVGTARLRITLSASHTQEDVARLLGVLHQLERQRP